MEPSDLLNALQRVESRGVCETAHRVRSLYDRIERYAMSTGGVLERGISSNMKGALTGVPDGHFAAITDPKRVGLLMRAIAGYQGQPTVEIALKLAPYVFVRPGELRLAQWHEFDPETARREIPADRMKMGKAHIVPLSRQALGLLQQLKMHTGPDGLLFPGLLSKSHPIFDNTMNAALRRLGFWQSEVIVHGFRATARTLLDEQLTFRVHIIEHQLAHQVPDPNGTAYNRTSHIEERALMMQAFGRTTSISSPPMRPLPWPRRPLSGVSGSSSLNGPMATLTRSARHHKARRRSAEFSANIEHLAAE